MVEDDILDRVEAAVAAATEPQGGDPLEIGELLKVGREALSGGDAEIARSILEPVLGLLTMEEVDLTGGGYVSENELGEMLGDVAGSAWALAAAIYVTTPVDERAVALEKALHTHVAPYGLYGDPPLKQLAQALGGPLPEREAFLPSWLASLERAKDVDPTWRGEVVGLMRGPEGLAEEFRKDPSIELARAWTNALFDAGDWAGSVAAFEEAAARLPGASGVMLDGAARAAQMLGPDIALAKAEAAWRAAPTENRMLRWVFTGQPAADFVADRCRVVLGALRDERSGELGARCSLEGLRFLFLLLAGDANAALELLENSEGTDVSSHAFRIAALVATGERRPRTSARAELTEPATYALDEDLTGTQEHPAEAYVDEARKEAGTPPWLEIWTEERALVQTNVAASIDRLRLLGALRGLLLREASPSVFAEACAKLDGMLYGIDADTPYAHAMLGLKIRACVELEREAGKAEPTGIPPWVEGLFGVLAGSRAADDVRKKLSRAPRVRAAATA